MSVYCQILRNLNFLDRFSGKNLEPQVSWKSIPWEESSSMRTDKWTVRHEAKSHFSQFANAPTTDRHEPASKTAMWELIKLCTCSYLATSHRIASNDCLTVKWMGCARTRPPRNFRTLFFFCLECLGTPAITSVRTARVGKVVPVNAAKATEGGSVTPPTALGTSPTIRPPVAVRTFWISILPARELNHSPIIQLVAYSLHWAKQTQPLFYALAALLKWA